MNSIHPTRTGLLNMYSRENLGDAAIYAAYAGLLASSSRGDAARLEATTCSGRG